MKNVSINYSYSIRDGIEIGQSIIRFMPGSAQTITISITKDMVFHSNGSGLEESNILLGTDFTLKKGEHVLKKREDVTFISLNTIDYDGRENISNLKIEGSWSSSFEETYNFTKVPGIRWYLGSPVNVKDIKLEKLAYLSEKIKDSGYLIYGDIKDLKNKEQIIEYQCPGVGGDITLLSGIATSGLNIGSYNYGDLSKLKDNIVWINGIYTVQRPICSWNLGSKRTKFLAVNNIDLRGDLDNYLMESVGKKFVSGTVKVRGIESLDTPTLAQNLANDIKHTIIINFKVYNPQA